MVEVEWGSAGIKVLSERTEAIVIVDVLSFSSSVDVAVSRGGAVLPCPWRDGDARQYAVDNNALLASANEQGYSLRPASLTTMQAGERLVLPSPNGAQLSWQAAHRSAVFAGCLRNASAVAEHLAPRWSSVGIIAAGERWPDGSTRFALEDWIGAGAVADALNALDFPCTPEAYAAAVAFRAFEMEGFISLRCTASAAELYDRGDGRDVELAFDLNVSTCVPALVNHAYVATSA